MSYLSKSIGIAVLILSSSITLLADGNSRTWTSKAGSSIEAEYIKKEGIEVKLRTPERVLWVRISTLSEADQKWIENQVKKEEEKEEEESKEAIEPTQSSVNITELPVLKKGDWEGSYAGYSAKNFDAVMDKRGHLFIFPKERRKRLDKRPLFVHMDCYTRGEGIPYQGISVKSFQEISDPAEQPSVIKLSGLLDRDVPFTINYHFSEEGIRIEGSCQDPKKIASPTAYRVRVRVPASHVQEDIDAYTWEETQELLKDWKIVAKSLDRETHKYGYSEIVVMGGQNKRVEIDAPHYGERRISFEAANPESAWLVPSLSVETSPWQGFSVQCSTDYVEPESEDFEFIIEIE